MRARQVFKTYNNLSPKENKDKFCLLCGSECIPKLDNGILRMACITCGHIQYQNPSPAVSILIVDNSKFLLCKRSGNHFQGEKWCLPCGFIEFNEDYLSAAVREVKEETGLDIEVQAIISVVSNFFKPDLHTLVIVLLAKSLGGVLNARDRENDFLEWFSIDKRLPEMAFEADAHIIRRYFNTKLPGAPVDPTYSKKIK
jgi:ADP-ribose pyrophosphatase YjhB (NUDIX family)